MVVVGVVDGGGVVVVVVVVEVDVEVVLASVVDVVVLVVDGRTGTMFAAGETNFLAITAGRG